MVKTMASIPSAGIFFMCPGGGGAFFHVEAYIKDDSVTNNVLLDKVTVILVAIVPLTFLSRGNFMLLLCLVLYVLWLSRLPNLTVCCVSLRRA